MIDAIVKDDTFPTVDAREVIQSFYRCEARMRNLSARIELILKLEETLVEEFRALNGQFGLDRIGE